MQFTTAVPSIHAFEKRNSLCRLPYEILRLRSRMTVGDTRLDDGKRSFGYAQDDKVGSVRMFGTQKLERKGQVRVECARVSK